MSFKLLTSRQIAATACLALALATAGHAEPVFRISTRSWDDANGNGLIDCSETVTLQIAIFDNEALPGDHVTGRVTLPSTTPVRWQLLPPIQQDFNLSAACLMGPVTSGTHPNDTVAVFDYSCTVNPDSPQSRGYALAVLVPGFYTGLSGFFSLFAKDEILFPTPTTLTASLAETRVQSCAAPDLQLTKSDGGSSVHPGQSVAFTLAYTNQGSDPADSVELVETVPASTVFNPAVSSPGWSCSPSTAAGSTCRLPLATLPLGASGSRTFGLQVLPTIPPSITSITNTASITTTSNDSNPSDNTASDSTPVTPGTPDLAVSKSVSEAGGSALTWSITVRNQGDGFAAGVMLTESIPAHTIFAPAPSPGWTCAGPNCSASLGLLAPGESRTQSFSVTLTKPLPAGVSLISNTACASTTSAGDPPANNCASASAVLSVAPSLSLAKTLASGTAMPGAVLVFRLDVLNQGDQDAGPVTLRETVPAHTTFEPAQSSPGWTCQGSGACTLTLPSLAGAGAAASRDFAVRLVDPLPAAVSSIANSACAATAGSADACSSIDVPTDGSPRLHLTKALASGTLTPGTVVVYAITVQNIGNQDAASVSLTETVPDHTSFVPASSSPGWSCTSQDEGGTCSLSIGTLSGGGTGARQSRSFAVRIDSPLPAGVAAITNTACAISDSPRLPRACDTVSSPPDAAPVLTISKSLASGTAEPGQVVIYDITVANTGNQEAANIVITDPVPAYTTFSAAESFPAWTCPGPEPVTCSATLTFLPAGSFRTLKLAFRIDLPLPPEATTLENTACAADIPARRVCATVRTPLGGEPVLRLEKTYDGGPLTPGKLLVFHLAVTNQGSRAASEVRLLEIVPEHSRFTAASSDSRWSCTGTGAGSSCTLLLGPVAAGGSATVDFAVTADQPLPPGVRQIANSACLTLPSGDTVGCSDVSTPLDTFVEATLDDALSTDGNGNGVLNNGDVLTYTLTVTNPSPQVATALVVTVPLDEHLGLVVGSVTTSGGIVARGNGSGDSAVRVEIPELPAGGSVTIVFKALATHVSVPGLARVSTQGFVSGSNFETEPTDDPATPEDDDPTATPLGLIAVHEVPTLGQLGLLLLAGSLGALALVHLRRRARLS